MQRLATIGAVAVVLVGIAVLPSKATPKSQPACAPGTTPPRYPVIAPVFERGCASCHDSRKAKNPAAQRVFEMSSYPFATERPATLLQDLRRRLAGNTSLDDAERCSTLGWIDGGGLDANGNLPAWRR